MLTSLNRLVGMPVVWKDKRLGYVERGVTDAFARRLCGVVLRKGIGVAKWVPSEVLRLVGDRCLLIHEKPEPVPKSIETSMGRVCLTTGERVGMVSDAVLEGATLRPVALEISLGPLYQLAGRSAYAPDYRVVRTPDRSDQVIVPRLMTWAELRRTLGEEGDG